MKHIIVKKPNGEIACVDINSDKFGPEYREIKETVKTSRTRVVDVEVDSDEFVIIDGVNVFSKKIIQVQENYFEDVEQVVKIIRPYTQCKGLKDFIDQGCEWYVSDEKPSVKKEGLESRKQFYHDGTNEVKKDASWDMAIMPDQLIKKKHLENVMVSMEVELAKETPDAISLVRNYVDHERSKKQKAGAHNDNPYWVQKAIDGLARAETDKPAVRQKLQAKLEELNDRDEEG